jgi:hypothetical protein
MNVNEKKWIQEMEEKQPPFPIDIKIPFLLGSTDIPYLLSGCSLKYTLDIDENTFREFCKQYGAHIYDAVEPEKGYRYEAYFLYKRPDTYECIPFYIYDRNGKFRVGCFTYDIYYILKAARLNPHL